VTGEQSDEVIWAALTDPDLTDEQKFSAIRAARDEYGAWLVEQHARPPVAESLLDNPVVRWAD
jgi:hypothetical protein